MNTKKILFALLAIVFSLNAHAQLCWKVSGNGLSKPSYLFGTHHLIEKEKVPNFDKIAAIVPQSDVVVGEMDMSNMLGMQIKTIKACMMKDTTMHDLLTQDEYALVDSRMKEVVGKGLDKLGVMKPVMLSTMYELTLYMKQNNLKKAPEAVDIVIQNKGKKAKKKIVGLETIDEQVNILFNSSSLKQQAEGLVEVVKDKEKSLGVIEKLNAAYLAGDLKAMSQLVNEEQYMSEADKKVMITDRNNKWIAKLKTLMPKQSCFVAVGCMHLADEAGLIQQLKNAGYVVEPVVF
jgi:uncharacterized protein YbaP (TraB family)